MDVKARKLIFFVLFIYVISNAEKKIHSKTQGLGQQMHPNTH